MVVLLGIVPAAGDVSYTQKLWMIPRTKAAYLPG
jgi:hypothetical protein